MEAYVGTKRFTLDDKNAIYGGEARVFLKDGLAIKIYHAGFLDRKKIEKLTNFPRGLPAKVIGPDELAKNKKGEVIGYAMPEIKDTETFVMLSNFNYRRNFPNEQVQKLFLDALATLGALHQVKVVVGDMNNLNLLFRDNDVYYIDADSMQFGRYAVGVTTEKYCDPLLYQADFTKLVYTSESDNYSMAVMLFEALLLVHPFGGVHKKYPTLLKRAIDRISIFNPEVAYPKKAVHFKVLPDDLLEYFRQVFEKDRRGGFSLSLVENLRWTKCQTCGVIHARSQCPDCAQAAPAAIKLVEMVNRQCVAKIVFRTKGRIITARNINGKIKFLYEENDTVKREDGQTVMTASPDNLTRFVLTERRTIVGRKKKLAVIEREKIVQESSTEKLGNLSVLEVSGEDYFRLHGDLLVKNEDQIWGSVLEGQTWIRTSEDIGFGFYRIGMKTVYFLFNARSPGINDSLELPKIEGQLLDAECYFSQTNLLFLYTGSQAGQVVNHMLLLDRQGKLMASKKEEAINSKILSEIHNKVLGGNKIITASDEGLILLEVDNGSIREAKIFTDTEPFVDESMQLLMAPLGIYAIGSQEIRLLTLT